MTLIASQETATTPRAEVQSAHARVLALLGALWLILFFASLFSPPVLDDADGTHANAARQMALSGDMVTLRINNVRYLEKAPLPYWIVAASLRVFGCNTFAVHLPQALAVLLLMLLGSRWAREAFGEPAAFYTGLGVLTSAGVFLFTRVFFPDSLLSLLLAAALYCFLRALAPATNSGAPHLASEMWDGPPPSSASSNFYPYAFWTVLALAVLTKGLVAIVFLFGAAAVYLALTGEARHWRRLKPFSGFLLFLVIAAPWHILAGLRNTGGIDGHGFFWFYFINEHVLRFLGQRIPRDYNKLPGYLYWTLHLVWLFPWSLFLPLFFVDATRRWRRYGLIHPDKLYFSTPWIFGAFFLVAIALTGPGRGFVAAFPLACLVAWAAWRNRRIGPWYTRNPQPLADLTPVQKSSLLLAIFSFLVLAFFSLSTNQEYYTFPAYLPMLMLVAAALGRAEAAYSGFDPLARSSRRWITFAHASFTVIGLLIAAALSYGLWISRHLATLPNVGDLLAHRGVGDYTLSMSSLFDLTGPSFAALRLPAGLAMAAFAAGPAIAWMLRARRRHLAATTAIALTSTVFLIAAHLAFVRFAPMLSSQNFAQRIQQLEASGAISRDNTLLLFGDQAYGSSIPFYLNRPLDRPALLVDGRSSSMLFGSSFPDAQSLFLTPAELASQWGSDKRKILFVPLERRADVDRLLGSRQIVLEETAGKALITDRPLDLHPTRPLDR
jgi:hypothetical protein